MTRWLAAARKAEGAGTELTKPTKPHPGPVSSVVSVLSEGVRADAGPPPADGLAPDASAYLAHLRLHGPATYGAMARELGWGATRAWQAEARLRAAGLVTMGPLGKARPSRATR